jgi:hypothetical protein
MRFVTVSASQDIIMATLFKGFTVRAYQVITIIVFVFSSVSPTVLVSAATPVYRFQVPAKISAIDNIVGIMAIRT